MKLTENFTINELIFSETAVTNNIDNRPSVEVIANLKALCENVLQPLRDYLKSPVIITSGYRSRELNRKIGGVSNSQHILGQAVDFVVPDRKLKEVFDYIKNFLPYDQLLLESGKNGKWIHVSFRRNNRHQSVENYPA